MLTSSPTPSPTLEKKKATSSTTGSRMGTPSARRRSSTALEPEPGFEMPDEDAERPDDPVPQEDEELGPRVADERTTGTHSRRGNETWSAENGRPGIVAGGKKIVHLADIDEDEMTMEKMMSLLFLILNGISTSSKRLKCYPIQVRPIIKLAK